MSRKKITIKQKTPVPVAIQSHTGERSPHVIDLRKITAGSQQHEFAKPRTFEEKVALFDEKVKEVPELVRARAEHFTKIIETKRDALQESIGSFLETASDWGSVLQTRVKKERKARLRRRVVSLSLVLASLSSLAIVWKTIRRTAFKKRALLPTPFATLGHLGLFLVLLLLITIPVQGLLLYRTIEKTQSVILTNWKAGELHVGQLAGSLKAGDLPAIEQSLAAARENMKEVRGTIDRFGIFRALLPERITFGYTALRVAESAMLSGETLLATFAQVAQGNETTGTLLKTLAQESTHLRATLTPLLEKEAWLPAFGPLYQKVSTLEDATTVLTELSGTIGARNILVLFENPHELRATGGFAGSFALLMLEQGAITNVEIPKGGSYDVQGQLTLRRLSPEPLHLINSRFEFQDANWWPDFPTSAKKITELYEATGGSTIDGVLAVTANVGEALLAATGPIQAGGINWSSDHFIDNLEATIARDNTDNSKAPKKIIASLFPAMLKTIGLYAASHPKELSSIILQALEQKDIQVWSRSEKAEAAIMRLGISGTLKKANGDYLAVITSNVGGGKTDAVVQESVTRDVHVQQDGTAEVTLTLTRTHTGDRHSLLTGGSNISYLRLYVPKDATFQSAEGFSVPPSNKFDKPDPTLEPDPQVRLEEARATRDEQSGTDIWNEGDKRVFGNWLIVNPGKESTARLSYRITLPKARGVIPYEFIFDRQAGKVVHLSSTLTLDPNIRVLSGEGEGEWKPQQWHFEGSPTAPVQTSGMLYTL